MVTRLRIVLLRPGPVPSSERLAAVKMSLMACTPGAWEGSWPGWDPKMASVRLPMAENVSLTLIGVLVDFSLMHPGPVNLGPPVYGLVSSIWRSVTIDCE